MNRAISTQEIYELVDKKTNDLERKLGEKIDRLTDEFMNLEEERVSALEKQMAEIVANLGPIKTIVYGLVGLILTIVVSAIIYMVVKGGAPL